MADGEWLMAGKGKGKKQKATTVPHTASASASASKRAKQKPETDLIQQPAHKPAVAEIPAAGTRPIPADGEEAKMIALLRQYSISYDMLEGLLRAESKYIKIPVRAGACLGSDKSLRCIFSNQVSNGNRALSGKGRPSQVKVNFCRGLEPEGPFCNIAKLVGKVADNGKTPYDLEVEVIHQVNGSLSPAEARQLTEHRKTAKEDTNNHSKWCKFSFQLAEKQIALRYVTAEENKEEKDTKKGFRNATKSAGYDTLCLEWTETISFAGISLTVKKDYTFHLHSAVARQATLLELLDDAKREMPDLWSKVQKAFEAAGKELKLDTTIRYDELIQSSESFKNKLPGTSHRFDCFVTSM